MTIQREALQHEQYTLQVASQSLAQKSDLEIARLREDQLYAKKMADKLLSDVTLLEQRRDVVSIRTYACSSMDCFVVHTIS